MRRPTSTMSARSADSRMRHARPRARYLSRHAVGAEVDTRCGRRRASRARSGTHERAAHRIAHHLHAALAAPRCPRRPAARQPSTMPSTSRQNARATKIDEHDEAGRARQHQAPGFCARRRRDAPTAGCRARAWPPGLPGCPARAAITCCHACVAPSRSCLPNALHDADVQQRLGVLRIELQRVSNCSSALSG